MEPCVWEQTGAIVKQQKGAGTVNARGTAKAMKDVVSCDKQGRLQTGVVIRGCPNRETVAMNAAYHLRIQGRNPGAGNISDR